MGYIRDMRDGLGTIKPVGSLRKKKKTLEDSARVEYDLISRIN